MVENRMKEARFRSKTTQWQLAVMTQMSQTQIWAIENGYKRAKQDEQVKIAAALGKEVAAIFPDEER